MTRISTASYLEAYRTLGGKLEPQAFDADVALVQGAFEAGRQIITCGNGGSAYAACTS
jgi:D-sedoheptulose 7-phosphate isomerase